MITKPSILIVDDDSSIRKTLTAILEEKGYEVEAAETGKEAVEKSKTRFYNLALIDIRLPDIEGVELLTRIRETKPRMVKIILTGYPSLHNAVEALNKGADAYLIKPVNIEWMLTVIEDHLDRQRKAQEMTQDQLLHFIETRVQQLEKERLGRA